MKYVIVTMIGIPHTSHITGLLDAIHIHLSQFCNHYAQI